MALETAMSVQRIHRPRDDGNAERLTSLRAPLDEILIEPLDRAPSSRRRRTARRPAPSPPRRAGVAGPRRLGAGGCRRARSSGVFDSRPVLSSTTISGVPPVFIAAMGTPSALASMSTRLRDSGPARGEDQERRVREPCRGRLLIDPADDPDVAAGSGGLVRDQFLLRSRTSDDERPVEVGAFDCRHEVRRAFVRRELPEIQRVWSRHAAAPALRRDSATPGCSRDWE